MAELINVPRASPIVIESFIYGLKAGPYEDRASVGRPRCNKLLNITNANPVTGIVDTSGASFLRPLAIVSPRIARIGAKFEW